MNVHPSKHFFSTKWRCLLLQIEFIHFGEEQSRCSAHSSPQGGADGSNLKHLIYLCGGGTTRPGLTGWKRTTAFTEFL